MQSYLTDGTSDTQVSRQRPAYWGKDKSIKFTVDTVRFEAVPAADFSAVEFKRLSAAE
jgi:hypothetical protein